MWVVNPDENRRLRGDLSPESASVLGFPPLFQRLSTSLAALLSAVSSWSDHGSFLAKHICLRAFQSGGWVKAIFESRTVVGVVPTSACTGTSGHYRPGRPCKISSLLFVSSRRLVLGDSVFRAAISDKVKQLTITLMGIVSSGVRMRPLRFQS